MATVLDSLLVTLGLDPSGYKKGAAEVEKTSDALEAQRARHEKARDVADKKAGDAQRKRAKEMEAFGKKTSDTFDKVRNQALALAAVFTAGVGIASFVKNTITSVATIGRLSNMTDMSTRKIAAWQLAFKEVGGTAEEANGQILKMSNDIASFKAGNENSDVTAFLKFGGSAQAVKGGTAAYMQDMARLLAQLKAQHGTGYAWQAAQQMGVSFNQFQLLSQGPQALGATLERTERMTNVTGAAAEKAALMQRKWEDLKESLSQTGRTILFALMPALDMVAKKLQGLANWAITHKDTIKGWVTAAADAFSMLATVIENLAAIAVPLLKDVADGWKNIYGWVKILGEAINNLIPKSWSDKLGKGVSWLFDKLGIKGQVDKMMGLSGGSSAPSPAASGASSGGTGATRGIRNNNPGNIRFGAFAKAHGATGADDKGFAIFPTMAAGEAAGQALLASYKSGGYNTIGKMISRWAPSNENDTAAYIRAVSKSTGIDPNATLSDDQLGSVANAIYQHENGARAWTQYAASMPTGARAGRFAMAGSSTSNNSTVSTNIQQITINTRATDAQGIASTIGPAINGATNSLNWQANTGMG